ncbi:hypothetical protein BGZ54_000665 [Gamsiella multidivaricata]|nr:hypothetical protein BGZ54_000665 [Gamsiella multidivaricata]
MPAAHINTINQDFCLFDQEDSCFDYPLFNGFNGISTATAAAVANKALKIAHANNNTAAINNSSIFDNPLCTPQTPSLDLAPRNVPQSISATNGLGFDSCVAFLEDSAMANQLMDTPFTTCMDTPSLIDTPLETPFLTDFDFDSIADKNVKLAQDTAVFPLFQDFEYNLLFASASTIEPNMLFPIDQCNSFNSVPIDVIQPSPTVSDLSSAPSSPAKSGESDFSDELESVSDEDDDEFVPSRSAALVSGLKRKVETVNVSPAKKVRSSTDAVVVRRPAVKRFSCNHSGCDRQFARLFNLHTHEKTHNPEQARPFLCPEADCGKAFSRKHDLQRHEASVHKGERNFACTNCKKPFSRQDGLRRHLAVKGPCFINGWLAT